MGKTLFILLGVFMIGSADAGEYKVDPLHSSVIWHVNHFGFSNTYGKWMMQGTLEFDPQHPKNSQANISIDVDTILTGVPDLDLHLKGKQFFEVEKFPTAIFISKKVSVDNHKISEVSGDLTIHGITRPVTFKVKQNKIGPNPVNDRPTIGFSGKTTLKRSDFGLLTLLPIVSDEVDLNVEVEAYQDAA